jgi:hypothetical protein
VVPVGCRVSLLVVSCQLSVVRCLSLIVSVDCQSLFPLSMPSFGKEYLCV